MPLPNIAETHRFLGILARDGAPAFIFDTTEAHPGPVVVASRIARTCLIEAICVSADARREVSVS
jgi:hypothetical protein